LGDLPVLESAGGYGRLFDMPVSPAFVVFAALLLATGVMRLTEGLVSARRIRRRPAALVAEPWLFPLMALLHTGLVFGPLAEVVWLERPFIPQLAALAATVLALATLLRIWALRTIGRAWNVRVLRPTADEIVTTGPYAWVRHPNYLAVILEIAAFPLLHTAWVSCLALSAVNVFVLYHRVRLEEAQLEHLPAWRDAMANRARWIPGLF
jgi:methyltransferase